MRRNQRSTGAAGATLLAPGSPCRVSRRAGRGSKRSADQLGSRPGDAAPSSAVPGVASLGPAHSSVIAQRATPSTALRLASTPLALPVISEKVPQKMSVVKPSPDLANIAEALMGLGILTEGHWQHQGQIMDSVQMALDEWIDEEGTWIELQRMEPYVTHNLKEATQYTEPHWSEFFTDLDPVDGERVGAVYIDVYHQGTYIWAKNFVFGLEALESGLGWTIYNVLARALDCTIGVADHRWACDELSMRGDYYGDEEDEENSLTIEKYEAAHPEQLRNWEIDRAFLERVNVQYRDTHNKLIWEVTTLALRLLDLCPAITARRTREWFLEWDHSPLPDEGIYEHYVNTVMAWDGDDDVIRIHDDLTQGLMESGESCTIQWMFCFKVGHPRWTVRQAFEKLGWCLKMLGCIDRLARQFNLFHAMSVDMATAAITRIGDDENVVRLPA